MIFLPLGSFVDGQRAAEKANQEDFNNAVKNDVLLQNTEEFFAGAEGRTAAKALESDRLTSAAKQLQPHIETLGRGSMNSALGKNATNSVRGIFEQQTAAATLPLIPQIAQNTAQERAARVENGLVQSAVLTPMDQALRGQRNMSEQNLLPQRTDTTRARLQHSELISDLGAGKATYAERNLPIEQKIREGQLNIASLQSELTNLTLMPQNVDPGATAMKASQVADSLRAAGLIGETDMVVNDPAQGWSTISTASGDRVVEPLSVMSAKLKELNAQQGKAKAGKETKYVTRGIFDEQGRPVMMPDGKTQMTEQVITTYGSPPVSNAGTGEAAPAPAGGVDVLGGAEFLKTPEELAVLQQARAANANLVDPDFIPASPVPAQAPTAKAAAEKSKINTINLMSNPLLISMARTEVMKENPNASGEEFMLLLQKKKIELSGGNK